MMSTAEIETALVSDGAIWSPACPEYGSVTHKLFQPRVTGVIGAETLSGQDR